ncbi:MAG: GGDEF domain-containing protein [Acaryochloridaceae cyanobacterium RL_2_7]|nr:GGDEF domain-containing protein [Acaryochloridaceae cyanobacterium RL_2_7]
MDARNASAIAASGSLLLTALSQQAKWKHIATHDALTKIANRRHIDDVLDQRVKKSQRSRSFSATLIFSSNITIPTVTLPGIHASKKSPKP